MVELRRLSIQVVSLLMGQELYILYYKANHALSTVLLKGPRTIHYSCVEESYCVSYEN